MDYFSPMMMFKPLQPPILRSHASHASVSDPNISIMGCSHSMVGGVLEPMSFMGSVMCSYSYVRVFDYIHSVISQNIADAIDQQILADIIAGTELLSDG